MVQRQGELPTRTQEMLQQNSINDYACCLLQNNTYTEAETLLELCFEKYQQWGTEEEIPFEYSKYFHNIGTVRMYQGQHEEAVAGLHRATDLTQIAMGKAQTTYKVLRDRYMYACILLQAGKLQEAYEVHFKVLQDRESLCGEQNELTLESYYAVGAMCDYLGDLEGARRWISRSVELAPKTKWHDMSLGRAQVHLAKILRILNVDKEQALHCEQSSREILRALDSEIPDYMKENENLVAVFDALHSFCEGRFVNRDLLKIIQSGPSSLTKYPTDKLWESCS